MKISHRTRNRKECNNIEMSTHLNLRHDMSVMNHLQNDHFVQKQTFLLSVTSSERLDSFLDAGIVILDGQNNFPSHSTTQHFVRFVAESLEESFWAVLYMRRLFSTTGLLNTGHFTIWMSTGADNIVHYLELLKFVSL